MKIKNGVVLAGLDVRMRPVLGEAEKVWKNWRRKEGVTVTCGLDGVHSAESWHYYGLALDLRTRYFSEWEIEQIEEELKRKLWLRTKDPRYQVVVEATHIHVECDLNVKRI